MPDTIASISKLFGKFYFHGNSLLIGHRIEMLEEFSSQVHSIFFGIARRLVTIFVLSNAFVGGAPCPSYIDARLALNIEWIRFSEALVVHYTLVEGNNVNARTFL